jgi:uncharacterized protein (TIGR00297 family)
MDEEQPSDTMTSQNSTHSEYKRKAVHIGSSLFALLLRYLTWWQAALCAVAAFVFNALILPRIGGRNLYRSDDLRRGFPIGILLYPISVLLLILLFPHRLYIAAAGWAIMAWGDGFASVVGRKYGSRKLPWNPNRSWAGSVAFIVIGGIAAVFFTAWTFGPHRPEPALWYVVGIPLLASLLAAVVETVPCGIDDNASVPLTAGLLILALHQIDPSLLALRQPELLHNLAWGSLFNLAIAGAALLLGMVSVSGFSVGLIIGTVIYAFGGYRLFLVLLAFFILGSGATRFGYARKKALGVAQEKGGARGWRNATANCSLAAFLSVLHMLSPEILRPIFAAGFFGAFATAAADTVSSEIGQVLGKHPILITNLRRVPVGTEGAISLEGTLAGILASIVVSALGTALGVLSAPLAGICVIAAFIGTTAESYLGATLETMKVIDNEIINFMNTLAGAGAAMALAALIQ